MNKPFYTLTVGDDEYKLTFSAGEVVALEDRLGAGLLETVSDKGVMSRVGTQVTMLHAAAQKFQHGFTKEDALDLYDAILRENNGDGIGKVMDAIIGAMVAGGFMPPATEPEAKEKQKSKPIKIKEEQ